MRRLILGTALLAGILGWNTFHCHTAWAVQEPTPTSELAPPLVAYEFEARGGEVVHDVSGVEPAADLQIDAIERVRWGWDHLQVIGSVRIRTQEPPAKLIDAIKRSGELTIEAWVKPANLAQNGPARIVTLSDSPNTRNFTLGQALDTYDARLRAEATSLNGMPSLGSGDASASSLAVQQVVFSRNQDGATTLRIDGELKATGRAVGSLDNWSNEFQLVLGNEASGDRPWLGELHAVAIFDRVLSDQELSDRRTQQQNRQLAFESQFPPAAAESVDFVTHVAPILKARCLECHASGNEEGGLNLGLRDRALEGGRHGASIVPGDSLSSSLLHRVAGLDPSQAMPPEEPALSATEVGILRKWIDEGAIWPASADLPDPRIDRAREHWAFRPLVAPELPSIENSATHSADAADDLGEPIDRLIDAKLVELGIEPGARADHALLLRRLSFDLIGLPPTAEELQDFAQASAADPETAFRDAVERLLASEAFGERWARHWLDVARYADSDGQEGDRDRPAAWRYRDFVIRAFNNDLPYDQFVAWQLAGDELAPAELDALAATGFLTAGPSTELENTFLEEERLRNRYNELDDMLSTMGVGMLGLTVGCARCHDHKYDAISAREYYRLLAAFHSGDRKTIQQKFGASDSNDIELLVFADAASQPATTWLFDRGDFRDRDQEVQLGFPAVLTQGSVASDYLQQVQNERQRDDSSYQRAALAAWMIDVEHGAGRLLARVIVNRIWQRHFGEGLVRTVDDFGVRGDLPTHPELLDWLAADLVAHDWSLKHLHRRIVSSRAYARSTEVTSPMLQGDPDGRWLSHRRPRRLEAEVLRDAMLAAAGTLELDHYGPPFKPKIAEEAMVARNLKTAYPTDVNETPDTLRRSVYMFHKRVVPYPLFQAFDKPDALQACGRRESTTVAPQALAILNDPFVRSRAAEFARRLEVHTDEPMERVIERSFVIALGRRPESDEVESCSEFVRQAIARRSGDAQRSAEEASVLAWTDFCQALFGLNEFLYVD